MSRREDLDLDAIEQRAEAATPGDEWSCGIWIDAHDDVHSHGPEHRGDDARSRADADAAFIAAARTDVPILVVEVRRLRALPVIAECRTCRWCVGFGDVSRKTKRFVGTFHCEHPDAPRDEGSTERADGKGGCSWSRPMMVDENGAPPVGCPLRGAR